jgi:neutral ceramidase
VLRLTDTRGDTRSLLFSFPCHPSSTGGKSRSISAEYPGRLCQLADARLYGCTSLFLQGFGGDAKSRYSVSDDGNGFKAADFTDIDQMAAGMFEAVTRAMKANAFTPVDLSLAGTRFTISLGIDVYPREHFRRQYEVAERGPVFIRDCAQYILDHYDELKEELDLHASILKLSDDMYIFALGGEPSYDVGVVLRRAFPNQLVLCIGYCDDIAYIPSDKLIKEGGYESDGSIVEYRLKGRIAAGVDAALVGGFRNALRVLEHHGSSR